MNQKAIELVKPTLVPWEEVQELFAEVWRSGRLTVGPFGRHFEETAAELMRVKHAVAVSSCTSGLMLVLRALNLSGEVIIPSFTWSSTGHALVWNGLKPVFADIDPLALTMDPRDAARRITPATSAILTANIFGLYPDMDALREVAAAAGIPLLCDSAQAIGATYRGRIGGGLCRAEIFSFSPTKVVTAVEGGLITTDDAELARQMRNMRDYGKSADGNDVESFGLSARLSEFHAIVGWSNLKVVEQLIAARERLVGWYCDRLQDLPGLSFQTPPEGSRSSQNYFVALFDPARYDRDFIWHRMKEQAVQTKRYFYPPLHLQGSYRDFPPPDPPLPITEAVSNSALALPLYSHMTEEEVDIVCERLRMICSS